MNTKNISIALILIGSLLYATSGNLFSLTPDGWRVIFYKSGQIALVLGGLLALYHGATIIADQLLERLRSDAKRVVESNNAVNAVISDFATEFVEQSQKANDMATAANDLAECQAHFAANTALPEEAYVRIADLIVRLGRIVGNSNTQASVAMAEKLRKQLERLLVTHNGFTGPALLEKADAFLDLHKAACEKYAAFQEAERALNEAKSAHAAALAALDKFAA